MENFKRSTARDFRINSQTVDAIFNESIEEEEEEDEEENGEEGGGEEDGTSEGQTVGGDEAIPPKAKRLKRI